MSEERSLADFFEHDEIMCLEFGEDDYTAKQIVEFCEKHAETPTKWSICDPHASRGFGDIGVAPCHHPATLGDIAKIIRWSYGRRFAHCKGGVMSPLSEGETMHLVHPDCYNIFRTFGLQELMLMVFAPLGFVNPGEINVLALRDGRLPPKQKKGEYHYAGRLGVHCE